MRLFDIFGDYTPLLIFFLIGWISFVSFDVLEYVYRGSWFAETRLWQYVIFSFLIALAGWYPVSESLEKTTDVFKD